MEVNYVYSRANRQSKKGTLSKDSEKSKARINEEYKALSSQQKNELAELSTMSKNVLYNAASKGTASPKIVLSLGQIANISPYYLIGMADEKESFSEEIVSDFLKEFNIPLEIKKAKKGRGRKAKTDDIPKETAPVIEEVDTPVAEQETVAPIVEEDVKSEVAETVIEDEPCECDCEELEVTVSFDNSEKMQNAVDSLDEESAIILLKALLKRAETGGKAGIICDVVKRCLLA